MKFKSALSSQLLFVLLQVGDFVTTWIVLKTGGGEGNPIVKHLMLFGTLQGLLLSKVLLLAIATIAVKLKKMRVIRTCNIVFALIVAWNLSVVVRLALNGRAG